MPAGERSSPPQERAVERLFGRYDESHRNRTNKAIHWVCVPLIMWSLLAALWAWTPAAAVALVVAALVFYAWMSIPLAVGMALVSVVMLSTLLFFPGRASLLVVAGVVFVLAWIGQFIGHHIERRRPSFVDDVKFLLVGPAWLVAALYRRLRIGY